MPDSRAKWAETGEGGGVIVESHGWSRPTHLKPVMKIFLFGIGIINSTVSR